MCKNKKQRKKSLLPTSEVGSGLNVQTENKEKNIISNQSKEQKLKIKKSSSNEVGNGLKAIENKEDKKVSSADPLKEGPLISEFRVSQGTVELLKKQGIERMFPIQAATYDIIYDGKDVVGQAKTGSGKTLAFALPIIERLKLQKVTQAYGRKPCVIVLLPTRELAKQVMEQFLMIAGYLKCVCVYGGTPYGPQQAALRRGVDIVVGTTGRIKDLIEKKRSKVR